MTFADIQDGVVVNMIELPGHDYERYVGATGKRLIAVVDDSDVVIGDFYDEETGIFSHPSVDGAEIPVAVSVSDLRRQIDDLKLVVETFTEAVSTAGIDTKEVERVVLNQAFDNLVRLEAEQKTREQIVPPDGPVGGSLTDSEE